MSNEKSVEPAPSGKKKWIVIGVAVLLLSAIGGGAFFWFSSATSSSEPQESSSAKTDRETLALYIAYPVPFIFNVQGEKQLRMAQVNVQLMVRGEENERLAKEHIVLIESAISAELASGTVEQLRSANGQTELRMRVLERVQSELQRVVEKPLIEKVLFTDFVMQ
ncbi:MAG: flagellar basal body-associated FliL family protein [Vibrionaceae bacterium]